MSLLTKEQLRNFISENNIQSIPDLYTSLKTFLKILFKKYLKQNFQQNLATKDMTKKTKILKIQEMAILKRR
ncbi:hypothetical protein TheetDRAFT_0575 [Thermoanaerobacter ethanolicus JW 200]|nr:hypothetical protein TheetDRAFT_0575 [Thermoanaerobacter ethanolicus JW 200]